MTRPLAINADVVVQQGSQVFRIRGLGSQIFVELPDVRTGLRLLKGFGLRRRKRLKALIRILRYADLRVTFRTPRRKLLSIGDPGDAWWLRVLGFPYVRVHFRP